MGSWRRFPKRLGAVLSVTNATQAGTCHQGDSGWGMGWAPWRRGGGGAPSLPMHPWGVGEGYTPRPTLGLWHMKRLQKGGGRACVRAGVGLGAGACWGGGVR